MKTHYFDTGFITAVKGFIVHAQGVYPIKIQTCVFQALARNIIHDALQVQDLLFFPF